MTLLKTLLPYVVIAILIFLYLERCNKSGDLQDTNTALADTLTITRDSLGRETAKISIIVGNRKRDLKRIKTKDKTIKELQGMLKRGTVAATVLVNTTSGTVVSPTKVLLGDTINNFIYPTYWTMFENEWESFNITANKDTFDIDYKVYNHFEISQAYEKRKKGLFRKKVPVITVYNLNPKTETKELKSFAIRSRPRRFSFGVGTYAGLSVPTGKPTVIIGGGIQYNILGR